MLNNTKKTVEEDEIRQAIVAAARRWIGVKWVHQGRSAEGIDCAGLVILVGKELGLTSFDTQEYKRRPDTNSFVEYFTKGGGIRVPINSAKPGDILVMREQAYPCHATILTSKKNKLHIVHAHLPKKSVVEEPLDGAWLDKRVACFSYPILENV